MAIPEKQRKYNQKNIKRVPLDMQKSYYDKVLKAYADECGMNVNTFIKTAISELIRKGNKTMIYTADRETGTFIEQCDTIEHAKMKIAEYEEQDKKDDTYEEDFYDIVDEDHCHIEW